MTAASAAVERTRVKDGRPRQQKQRPLKNKLQEQQQQPQTHANKKKMQLPQSALQLYEAERSGKIYGHDHTGVRRIINKHMTGTATNVPMEAAAPAHIFIQMNDIVFWILEILDPVAVDMMDATSTMSKNVMDVDGSPE